MKYIKEKYKETSIVQTEHAIKFLKDTFEKEFAKKLNLTRVSAPLFVTECSGLNDDLNGVERKVCFDIKKDNAKLEVVQSLAKWKRMALYKYNFKSTQGLYTDMNAIRRDDEVDQIHSIYVDQWDFEKVVEKTDRNLEFLKAEVQKIADAIYITNSKLIKKFNIFDLKIKRKVYFITSQELLDMFPSLSPKQREYEICKKHKTVFIMQVGKNLTNHQPHDGRAPDYDDWDLNGDLMLYCEVLDSALELSSMGIRVDEVSLIKQLSQKNQLNKLKFEYHSLIKQKKLPLTFGGGIGQSRLCMLLMQKAHIGEVQASYWPDKIVSDCKKQNITLL